MRRHGRPFIVSYMFFIQALNTGSHGNDTPAGIERSNIPLFSFLNLIDICYELVVRYKFNLECFHTFPLSYFDSHFRGSFRISTDQNIFKGPIS